MAPSFLFLSLKSIRFASNPKSRHFHFIPNFLSPQSSFSNPTQFPTPTTQFTSSNSSPTNPNPNPNFKDDDFITLCTLLKNPDILPCRDLENSLEETGIEPTPVLLRAVLKQLDSSPTRALSLFKWAEKRPGYDPSAPIFNLVLGILARSGEFKWAFMFLLEKIKRVDGSDLVSASSFGVLIRHYVRSGNILSAFYTFEFGNSMEMDLFEVLLTAHCKYGHVSVASDYMKRKMDSDPNWAPSVDVYNILFDGWFRSRNLEMVKQVWLKMRRENLVPNVVTYGVLVDGYCRMGFVAKAVELLNEMRRRGVRPDGSVYDPIIDALAKAGRLKEALGMLERFLVLEIGPSLLTYNCLVKGFCEAGDIVGGGRILKMMTSRGVIPTSMTYNYFFQYFKKHSKVEDAVNLYRKMINSGYNPDSWTYRLILKTLCEQEELQLAMEIIKMRCSEQVLDLTTSTMLIDLLCKKDRLKEAVAEFENIIESGFVPKYISYLTLHNEIKRKKLHDLAMKLSDLMAKVPRSTTFPITVEQRADMFCQRRKAVMLKAKTMSDILKSRSNPKEVAHHRGSCRSSNSRKSLAKDHNVDKGLAKI